MLLVSVSQHSSQNNSIQNKATDTKMELNEKMQKSSEKQNNFVTDFAKHMNECS